MKNISFYRFLCIIGMIVGLQACYYDNEEDLYPTINPPTCDTLEVSLSLVVVPILDDNCISCHSGGTPAANINLEGYDDLLIQVNNGNLLGVIRHDARFSPMPKGGNQLADCDIDKIAAWVSQGAKNN